MSPLTLAILEKMDVNNVDDVNTLSEVMDEFRVVCNFLLDVEDNWADHSIGEDRYSAYRSQQISLAIMVREGLLHPVEAIVRHGRGKDLNPERMSAFKAADADVLLMSRIYRFEIWHRLDNPRRVLRMDTQELAHVLRGDADGDMPFSLVRSMCLSPHLQAGSPMIERFSIEELVFQDMCEEVITWRMWKGGDTSLKELGYGK